MGPIQTPPVQRDPPKPWAAIAKGHQLPPPLRSTCRSYTGAAAAWPGGVHPASGIGSAPSCDGAALAGESAGTDIELKGCRQQRAPFWRSLVKLLALGSTGYKRKYQKLSSNNADAAYWLCWRSLQTHCTVFPWRQTERFLCGDTYLYTLYIHTYICTLKFVCVSLFMHIYRYIYIYIFVNIHIYIYIFFLHNRHQVHVCSALWGLA